MYNFDVFVPQSLKEALELKSDFGSNIVPLAGGTDLLVAHRIGKKNIKNVMNLWHVNELKSIKKDDHGIHIGALVTYSEALINSDLQRNFPSFLKSIRIIGSLQIRNLGTIVGNICNASPAADSTPLLYCANATVTLKSLLSEKTIAINDFITGPNKLNIDEHSIVTKISIPDTKDFIGDHLTLRQRIPLSINKISVAALMKIKDNQFFDDVRLALGAVGPTIIRVTDAELYLNNRETKLETIKKGAKICYNTAIPITDVRSSIEYRKAMTDVLTVKLLLKLSKIKN